MSVTTKQYLDSAGLKAALTLVKNRTQPRQENPNGLAADTNGLYIDLNALATALAPIIVDKLIAGAQTDGGPNLISKVDNKLYVPSILDAGTY